MGVKENIEAKGILKGELEGIPLMPARKEVNLTQTQKMTIKKERIYSECSHCQKWPQSKERVKSFSEHFSFLAEFQFQTISVAQTSARPVIVRHQFRARFQCFMKPSFDLPCAFNSPCVNPSRLFVQPLGARVHVPCASIKSAKLTLDAENGKGFVMFMFFSIPISFWFQ